MKNAKHFQYVQEQVLDIIFSMQANSKFAAQKSYAFYVPNTSGVF